MGVGRGMGGIHSRNMFFGYAFHFFTAINFGVLSAWPQASPWVVLAGLPLKRAEHLWKNVERTLLSIFFLHALLLFKYNRVILFDEYLGVRKFYLYHNYAFLRGF